MTPRSAGALEASERSSIRKQAATPENEDANLNAEPSEKPYQKLLDSGLVEIEARFIRGDP